MPRSSTIALKRRVAVAFRREPVSIEKVLADAQVREQPSLLKDVADAAPVLRHEDAAFGIGEDFAVDDHAAAVRADQAGDDVDERWSCPSRTRPNSAVSRPALSKSTSKTKVAEADARRRPRASSTAEPARRPARPGTPRQSAAIEITIEISRQAQRPGIAARHLR